MDVRAFLDILKTTRRLKDMTRHCYTAGGRHESVAEHSWMMTVMSFFLRDEFPEADMDKVTKMCIVHDLGECFTGDIPAFEKGDSQEDKEETLLFSWVGTLPEPYRQELAALYQEMKERKTLEARIYKAIDSLEAVIQHNDSDLSTWLPLEYDLQLTYGVENCSFSKYTKALRELIAQETRDKIDSV